MKKANKILMATVAILLSLVLITTSVVSGVFAKYAAKTYGSASFKFKKHGITVELGFSDAFKAAYGTEITNGTVVNGDSISVTIPNLKMGPGDMFTDAIQFRMSGKAATRLVFILDIDIDFDPSKFYIPGEYIRNGSPRYGIPIGFDYDMLNGESELYSWYDYQLAPWQCVGGGISDIDLETILLYYGLYYEIYNYGYDDEGNWDSVIGGTYEDGNLEYNNVYLETLIKSGEDIGFENWDGELVNGFNFSFEWPYETTRLQMNGDPKDWDEVETYFLRAGNNPSISVTYTIRIEQVNDEYFPAWSEDLGV